MPTLMNTKLATEYERQLKNKYPSKKTFITEMNGDIHLDFQLECKDNRNQNMVIDAYMIYESKQYTGDIPVRVYLWNYGYAGYVRFVDSFKTVEMNVNNLLIATNKLWKIANEVSNIETSVWNDYNTILSRTSGSDVQEAINWGKKNNILYQGIVENPSNIEPDDYWDSYEQKEEVRKAIAILRAVNSNIGATASKETLSCNSYGLKHRFEEFMKLHGENEYFSTGTAIIASYFERVIIGSYTPKKFDLTFEGPNGDFNLPLQSVLYFEALANNELKIK